MQGLDVKGPGVKKLDEVVVLGTDIVDAQETKRDHISGDQRGFLLGVLEVVKVVVGGSDGLVVVHNG